LEQVDTAQELLRQQLYGEFSIEGKAADKQMKAEPFAALERMEKIRAKVGASDLSPGSQKQLLTLIDRKTIQFRSYIDQHRSEIEQDDRNAAILASIDRDQAIKSETQNKIAQLVEEYNDLIEEQRWKEAEVRAKQVRALDPDSPIARTLMINASFGYRIREQQNIAELNEKGVYRALSNVGASATPFDDNNPIDFGNVDNWMALNKSPYRGGEMKHRQLSPTEIKIQAALKEQVQVRFTNRPLKEVLDDLGSMSNVNIYADPQGLSAEGVTSDTPITINLTEAVSLQSALKLILEPLRLSYVIQHEVLRVTSEQSGDANVYTDVYNVADLVIPIPNFVPGYNVGLPAAIREAHRALGYGDGIPSAMGPFTIAPTDLQGSVSTSASVLAQSNSFGLQSRSGSRPSTPLGYGNGSMGGAALADFDTLIELITSTIAPDTWDDVGGPGAIESFPTNLSLVISQTQDVHDQIADLLEQLRRLQDLQVTIEVRFITLRDDFFEQMGIDFDFDIDDNVTQLPQDDSGNSVTIGLDATGIPTADLDISFNQGSFAASQPAFGGFDAASAASIGFAILSDIEAFFVLQAAQGDQRSNVLQAPKVTLFNGQQASVSDTSQRPFVTSLIPVVGDFAAAHQPVIVVLSEGTSLSVQAVVSSDRRFVRLTLVPFFSQIGEVEEFTFDGTTTTDSGSNVVDPDGNPTAQDNVTTTTAGTTVQLPTFAFTTVSTTVSVPDGGTVLLGGIKRLREGRNEQGVPVLSKLPYINRLFKNVGIGRESQSLMLMVTPRIIIQEEEEEKLGIELTQ
jgi:general secretion pathway protein D